MVLSINGMDIFYKRHPGSKTIILLHGWGGSSRLMDGVFDFLASQSFDVLNIDLPGFGQSSLPLPHFGIDDYAALILQMIAILGLKDVIIIGHSFGGRIAILLGNNPAVKALILTSAAGIKPKFSLTKKLAVLHYKRAKKQGKDLSKFGSSDYKALNGALRDVFVRVVNRHLDKEVSKICVSTLLVWGKNDTETPLYMAKKIKKRVKDCGLVVLDGGHFCYLENLNTFCNIVKSFVLSLS